MLSTRTVLCALQRRASRQVLSVGQGLGTSGRGKGKGRGRGSEAGATHCTLGPGPWPSQGDAGSLAS